MDENAIIADLQVILRDVLEDETFVLTKEQSVNDIKGWDSLAHINIIELIESKFNIKFSLGEIVTLKKISDLILLIQSKSGF